MRGIAVALKAVPVTVRDHCFIGPSGAVAEERLMTPQAVLLYHPSAWFTDVNSLRLIAQCKYCGMPQPVTGFEIILPDKAVVRYMAGIAICNAFVCAVRPGGKLRCHYVAIDAHPRII